MREWDPATEEDANSLAGEMFDLCRDYLIKRQMKNVDDEAIAIEISWALNFVDAHLEDI